MSIIENFQLHLNSENADSVYFNNNCQVEFYLPIIEIPSQYHMYVSVEHASIPTTFYNINSNNNILVYVINLVTYTLEITKGNYNVTTLKNYLMTNMNNFTIIYDSIINAFTFTHTYYDFTISSNSTCLSLIGFFKTDTTSVSKILTSTRAVNLCSIRCICVHTNLKTSNISKTNTNCFNILCSIPITVSPLSIQPYTNNNNFKVNTFSNNISMLSIKLCDQLGNLIDLNGANWSMTIQFNIVDFVDE
jgi:hypothetical protein